MLFDKLCGIAERHAKHLLPMLRDSRLFLIECSPKTTAVEAVERWMPDERLMENYRLPFNTVAIECSGDGLHHCMVLQVIDAIRRRFRFALADGNRAEYYVAWGELTALPGADDPSQYMEAYATLHNIRVLNGSKHVMKEVSCDASIRKSSPLMAAVSRASAAITNGAEPDPEDSRIVKASQHILDRAIDGCKFELAQACVRLGVLSVLIINEPAKFVVEETPFCWREQSVNGPVVRSPYRQKYTVLKPRQIRTRFMRPEEVEAIESGEGMTRTPHERRGHFRKLQSERFTKAKGQVLWIKPCWIGPSEFQDRKNKYKVLIDV